MKFSDVFNELAEGLGENSRVLTSGGYSLPASNTEMCATLTCQSPNESRSRSLAQALEKRGSQALDDIAWRLEVRGEGLFRVCLRSLNRYPLVLLASSGNPGAELRANFEISAVGVQSCWVN